MKTVFALLTLLSLLAPQIASAQERFDPRAYSSVYMDGGPVYGRWHDRIAFPRTDHSYPMTENAGPSTATGGPSGGIN